MTVATLHRAAARRSEPTSWDLLDALPASLAAVDGRGVVVGSNRAWREVAFPRIGESVFELWDGDATPPLVRSTLRLGITEVLSGARARFAIEYPLQRGDDTVWLELSAQGRPSGALLWQSDVTARRRAEEHRAREHRAARLDLAGVLDEATRLKSEFVSVVSHELRTPIHVILGFAGLLADGELGDLTDEQRDATGRILFAARSLLELSDAALQLTRLGEARLPLHFEDVNLRELARDAEVEARGTHRGSTVPIELRLSPGLTHVRSDREKLKLILKNLLHNGLKFTPAGTVTLSIAGRGDDVAFVVLDTGVGIPEEALSTIFDAFRQADASSTRLFGGVGLGLHIVRRLTERLGGRVRAESVVGRGTRVEVVLPRDPDPRPGPGAATGSAA